MYFWKTTIIWKLNVLVVLDLSFDWCFVKCCSLAIQELLCAVDTWNFLHLNCIHCNFFAISYCIQITFGFVANYSLTLKAEAHRSWRSVFKQSNDNWYNLDYINFNVSTIFVLQILLQRCSWNHYFNQRWMNRIESLLRSIALKWRIAFNGTFDHKLKLQERQHVWQLLRTPTRSKTIRWKSGNPTRREELMLCRKYHNEAWQWRYTLECCGFIETKFTCEHYFVSSWMKEKADF